MKKTLKIILFIAGIIGLLALIWIGLAISPFIGIRSYTPVPVHSPDGSKLLIPTINYDKDDTNAYLQVHIEIQDIKSGKSVFQVQTNASDRMRWSVNWLDQSTIQLDSSDIGLYCWQDVDGNWNEVDCP